MSYPLRFYRIAVRKPWADTRLAGLYPELADELPPGTGESIELADLPGQSSVVANGVWRGKTIRELMTAHRAELLGELADGNDLPDFPLAVKLLDTAQPLSIQDHPGDERENDRLVRRGKSECWIVLDAAPDAVIYQGLKPGVTPQQFEQALQGGDPPALLNARPVKAGDYIYNEAGMVHAVGGGLALLEVQQNCATTWRLWDFPRDKPREMHVQAGLEAARFDLQPPPILETAGDGLLLQPDGPFGVRSLRVKKGRLLEKDWPGFSLFTCLQGACELAGRERDNLQPARLKAGDTVLFPAGFHEFEVYPNGGAWLVLSWARE